jgi:hypothetical protein
MSSHQRKKSTSFTSTPFTDQDPPERTWHEIIPADVPPKEPTLAAQNNALLFSVSPAGGEGAVTFGDVVIFYTSSETTIQIPIVLVGDEPSQ